MKPYSLTKQRIEEFNSQGFISLPGQVPSPIIEMLYSAESELRSSLAEKCDDELHAVAFQHVGSQRYLCRVNDLLRYLHPEFLVLMGCPQLLDVAYSLCGTDALPTYESLMIRTLGDNTYTAFHQDMIHDRDSCIATFCIYLDGATPNDGSVRVIPGTQLKEHDLKNFHQLCEINNWRFHDLVATPGDLLLHDVMTIHDSPALTKRKQRRTIYLEFRSYEHLKGNRRFPDEWIKKREELMTIARSKYSAFMSGEPLSLTDEEKAFFSTLYSPPVQMEPANYPIFIQ